MKRTDQTNKPHSRVLKPLKPDFDSCFFEGKRNITTDNILERYNEVTGEGRHITR